MIEEQSITYFITPRIIISSDKGKWTHRDKHVQKILVEGVRKWRRESGFNQQSKVENTFYRYKTNIGKKVRARAEESR